MTLKKFTSLIKKSCEGAYIRLRAKWIEENRVKSRLVFLSSSAETGGEYLFFSFRC